MLSNTFNITYYRRSDNGDLHIILRTPVHDIYVGTIKADRFQDQAEAMKIIDAIRSTIAQHGGSK